MSLGGVRAREWQKGSGYHRQARVGNASSATGPSLAMGFAPVLETCPDVEASLGCRVLNQTERAWTGPSRLRPVSDEAVRWGLYVPCRAIHQRRSKS